MQQETKIDMIHLVIDTLIRNQEYNVIDELLLFISPYSVDVDTTLSLLTTTLPIKDRLENRYTFLANARGMYSSEMLRGL